MKYLGLISYLRNEPFIDIDTSFTNRILKSSIPYIYNTELENVLKLNIASNHDFI